MDFWAMLLSTLRAVESILRVPGVLIVGSEVLNLMEPDACTTPVLSWDVDIAVPVDRHAAVKQRLPQIRGLSPSRWDPSVWLPASAGLIEVDFIGMDTHGERAGETYVLEDDEFPLFVFRHLSLLKPGKPLTVEGIPVPVPRPAGLLLEKLLTDRSGEKGDRDLLVALGLMLVCEASDWDELTALYGEQSAKDRYAARSGLTMLSLLEAREQMPDPTLHRAVVAGVTARLESAEQSR